VIIFTTTVFRLRDFDAVIRHCQLYPCQHLQLLVQALLRLAVDQASLPASSSCATEIMENDYQHAEPPEFDLDELPSVEQLLEAAAGLHDAGMPADTMIVVSLVLLLCPDSRPQPT
jgi:hypothetical protein